jgi:multicomponent Na+:H+ antiporter subunit E
MDSGELLASTCYKDRECEEIEMTRAARAHRTNDALYWALLYAALWALFAEGGGWLLGVPTVLLAVLLSLWLGVQPVRLRLRVLPAFLGFFLRHMLLGGWDVAGRALRPRCPLQPGWHVYPLTSRSPRVRLLLSALVGLLPGTLASGIDGERMRIHVLDGRLHWRDTIAELEQRLEALLGEGGGR